MADEKRDSPETGGKRRRPTTIDLKATEIVSEPDKPTEAVEVAPETPQPAAPQAAAGETVSAPPEPAPGATFAPPDGDAASVKERLWGYRRDLSGLFDWRLMAAGAERIFVAASPTESALIALLPA